MQFSGIKAIIFDLDGTLVNTTKIDVGVFNDILIPKVDNIETYFGPKLKDILIILKNEKKIKLPINILLKLWHQKYKQNIMNQELFFPDTINTLKYLKKKYILGIITSSDRYVTNITLKQDHKYFDVILSADDYDLAKPNPESLYKIMKLLKLNANEILYVGDNYKDIIFAKNAGVYSVAKVDLLCNKNLLKKGNPDLIIKNISELKKMF